MSGFKVDDEDKDEVLIREEWGGDEAMMMMILKTCISDWDFHIDLLLLSYFPLLEK